MSVTNEVFTNEELKLSTVGTNGHSCYELLTYAHRVIVKDSYYDRGYLLTEWKLV